MTTQPNLPNGSKTPGEKQLDNRANQLNPDDERYRKARSLDKLQEPQPSGKKGRISFRILLSYSEGLFEGAISIRRA